MKVRGGNSARFGILPSWRENYPLHISNFKNIISRLKVNVMRCPRRIDQPSDVTQIHAEETDRRRHSGNEYSEYRTEGAGDGVGRGYGAHMGEPGGEGKRRKSTFAGSTMIRLRVFRESSVAVSAAGTMPCSSDLTMFCAVVSVGR